MLSTDASKAAQYFALAIAGISIASSIHWFISWLFITSNTALFVGYGLFFIVAIGVGWFIKAAISYLF